MVRVHEGAALLFQAALRRDLPKHRASHPLGHEGAAHGGLNAR